MSNKNKQEKVETF